MPQRQKGAYCYKISFKNHHQTRIIADDFFLENGMYFKQIGDKKMPMYAKNSVKSFEIEKRRA